ncbi:MAG: MATE family efflux transporter [Aureispira sp.]
MKTSISYADIFKLSIPIMIGSAVQNFITLTDTIFLGRVGEIELGAIGLVGVFYLMIASIGYSFSKAGQIMIARRVGSQELDKIGSIFYSMLAFALSLAFFLFLFMQFGCDHFFALFINNQEIYKACIAYLDYRSSGIFFSYAGVIVLALYTGVARTQVIIYNALMLGVANMLLNYALVFGHWGFPEMGIAGAGLASTIAEGMAFIIFLVYIILDKKNRAYHLFRFPKVDFDIIKAQLKLSMPIVLQSVVGMGSWFIFFIIIEDMGQTELAISNIMRAVYLLFMIPCWGFASSINTLASNLIGKDKQGEVFSVTTQTAILSFAVTMVFAISMLFAPDVVLRVGTDNPILIEESKRLTGVLTAILALFSIGAIYFNGLVGTGATQKALYLQILSVIVYLLYIYLVVHVFDCSLEVAWMAELIYWIVSLTTSVWYLRSNKWQHIEV